MTTCSRHGYSLHLSASQPSMLWSSPPPAGFYILHHVLWVSVSVSVSLNHDEIFISGDICFHVDVFAFYSKATNNSPPLCSLFTGHPITVVPRRPWCSCLVGLVPLCTADLLCSRFSCYQIPRSFCSLVSVLWLYKSCWIPIALLSWTVYPLGNLKSKPKKWL